MVRGVVEGKVASSTRGAYGALVLVQEPGGYRQVGRGSACQPSKLSMRGDRVSDVPFGLIALHDLVGVTAGQSQA